MKKQFFLSVLLIAGSFVSFAQFQQAAYSVHLVDPKTYEAKDIASASVKMLFHEQYPNANEEAWAQTGKGFLVSFTSGAIQYNVFLNKKGVMTSQVRTYTESFLPSAVRNQINDAYGRVVISSVKEVTTKGLTAYLVTITSHQSWKVLRLTPEDTEVVEEYKKG